MQLATLLNARAHVPCRLAAPRSIAPHHRRPIHRRRQTLFCSSCPGSLSECAGCLMLHCEGTGDPETDCLLPCEGKPGCGQVRQRCSRCRDLDALLDPLLILYMEHVFSLQYVLKVAPIHCRPPIYIIILAATFVGTGYSNPFASPGFASRNTQLSLGTLSCPFVCVYPAHTFIHVGGSTQLYCQRLYFFCPQVSAFSSPALSSPLDFFFPSFVSPPFLRSPPKNATIA